MSAFPTALRPAARSAYRSVLRSARVTFEGDPERHIALLSAVRQTFLSPTLSPPPPPSSAATATTSSAALSPAPVPTEILPESREDVSVEEIQKRIQEWKDVAVYLRRNVVQGVQDESGTFKLRVTPDTELGDNTTIREPPKLPTTPFPNRNKNRRKCGDAAAASS